MDHTENSRLRPFKRNFFELLAGKTGMPLRGGFS
jgi:hypothetical protein